MPGTDIVDTPEQYQYC